MMVVRSVHQLVLDEALDVLGELAAWLRLAHACPKCEAPQGCSHRARCPLGRVARLRYLLGSGDQQRRDVELAALRRERLDVYWTQKMAEDATIWLAWDRASAQHRAGLCGDGNTDSK